MLVLLSCLILLRCLITYLFLLLACSICQLVFVAWLASFYCSIYRVLSGYPQSAGICRSDRQQRCSKKAKVISHNCFQALYIQGYIQDPKKSVGIVNLDSKVNLNQRTRKSRTVYIAKTYSYALQITRKHLTMYISNLSMKQNNSHLKKK